MTKARTLADNFAADINGITAGTGITGGGTSGTVTITNEMATVIDAAGDLIYGTGSDAFTRLAVGTAGQVLQVNSGATAPEWAAAGGFSYSSYTPTHNNFTVGNGTVTAKYSKNGDYVHYIYRVVWGSTTSAVGSAWAPSYPETIDSTSDGWLAGNSMAYDASTGKYYPLIPSIGGSYLYSAPIFGATDSELDGTSVSSTNPFTWTTGDKLWINVVWKVA